MFLLDMLPPKPPEGGCVTFNRLMELHGPKLAQCYNALDYSPREKTLEHVVDLLKPALKGYMTQAKKDQIKEAMELEHPRG